MDPGLRRDDDVVETKGNKGMKQRENKGTLTLI